MACCLILGWWGYISLSMVVRTITATSIQAASMRYDCGSKLTRVRLQLDNLMAATTHYELEHGGCPGSLEVLRTEKIVSTRLRDPWGEPFAFTCAPGRIRLASAGPDRTLGSDDDILRARAMGGAGGAAVTPAARLVTLLGDGDVGVRQQAARALIEIGRAALPALEPALRHADPAARRVAAMVMGEIASAAPAPARGGHHWALVRQITGNVFLIDRSRLRRALLQPHLISGRCRIVPVFRAGRPAGFRVHNIRPGSIYHRLGLRSGDVVHTVNRMPITSPDSALEAYAGLRQARQISVGLRRRGKKRTHLYIMM